MVENTTRRQQGLAMETLLLHNNYAFTLNMADPPVILLLAYDKYKTWCVNKLSPIEGLDFEFTIEQSPTGRPHIHGIVKFLIPTAVIKFYEVLITEHGAYKMDTISDMETWRNYMYKNKKFVKPYLATYRRSYKITRDRCTTQEETFFEPKQRTSRKRSV